MKQPHGTSALAQLFGGELSVVNLGLESFADNLRACGVAVTQVRWKPPAGGDARMLAVLDRIATSARVDVEAANRLAVERILGSKPMLVGVGTAADVVPGGTKGDRTTAATVLGTLPAPAPSSHTMRMVRFPDR